MLGWCSAGQHDKCIREYERFYVDPHGKIVYTGQTVKCQCSTRTCKCYVAGTKKNKRKRRS